MISISTRIVNISYIYIYGYIYRERERETLSMYTYTYTIAYTPSPPTKSLDFRGFDSSRLLIQRGGNSHVR